MKHRSGFIGFLLLYDDTQLLIKLLGFICFYIRLIDLPSILQNFLKKFAHSIRVKKLSANERIGLVSLFNGISTSVEEQLWFYLTHSQEDKGFYTFPKSICPKVNVIARLEYELTYYDSAVHRFNHYTTRTPPRKIKINKSKWR